MSIIATTKIWIIAIFFLLGCSLLVHAGDASVVISNLESITTMEYSKDNITYHDQGKETIIEPNIFVDGISWDPKTTGSSSAVLKEKGYKFGYTITIPNDSTGELIANNLQSISFTVQSDQPLEATTSGVQYLQKSTIKDSFVTESSYVVFDFSDILSVLQYPTELLNETTGKPTGIFTNQQVPYKVSINKNTATITFDTTLIHFMQGQIINLDPTISINNVQNYTSLTSNITTEAFPLSHITINDSSVIFYYPFDVNKTSGNTIYDYSPNNNDGILKSNTLWNATGYLGGGITFDGVNSNFSIPGSNTSLRSASGTLMFWMKSKSDIDMQVFMSEIGLSGAEFGIEIGPSTSSCTNEIVTAFYNHSAKVCYTTTNRNLLFDGNWHHFAFTAGSGSSKLYIDGQNYTFTVVATDPATFTGFSAYNQYRIGSQAITSGETNIYNGSMDEFIIYNRVLTAAEVNATYQARFARYASPPATQLFQNITIQQNGSLNVLNITTNATLLNNSNLSVMILEYSGLATPGNNTANSTLLYIANGSNMVVNSSISTGTYNVSLLFNFTPSLGNNFYSPILRDTIQLDSYQNPAASGSTPTYIFENTSLRILLMNGMNDLWQDTLKETWVKP